MILFELLTGELPWKGADPVALANARLSGDTPSPRALVPGLDATWDDVVVACLQRDRQARPRAATDVARALGV